VWHTQRRVHHRSDTAGRLHEPDAEKSHTAISTRALRSGQPYNALLRCVMEHLIAQSCQSNLKGCVNSGLNCDKILVGVGGHHIPEQTMQAEQQMAHASIICKLAGNC